MDQRELDVKAAIAEMISEGTNLTAAGYPELPALKKASGFDNITSAERNKWSQEVIDGGGETAEEEQTQETPPEAENGVSEAGTPEPEPDVRVSVKGPVYFPTRLFHETLPTRQINDVSEWDQAREEGYKDLPEFPEDVAQAIHKRGQDPGLHHSQKPKG